MEARFPTGPVPVDFMTGSYKRRPPRLPLPTGPVPVDFMTGSYKRRPLRLSLPTGPVPVEAMTERYNANAGPLLNPHLAKTPRPR